VSLDSFKVKKGRDKLLIIAGILGAARNGRLKTQIMYRVNLSYAQLNDYLKFMVELGLLEVIFEGGRGTMKFRSTAKGLDFLQRYDEIHSLIKGEASEYPYQSNLSKLKSALAEIQDAIDILETGLTYIVKCPKCRESAFSDYQFCPYCGTKLKLEDLESVKIRRDTK
jgi:predicted transcriptional regulator